MDNFRLHFIRDYHIISCSADFISISKLFIIIIIIETICENI